MTATRNHSRDQHEVATALASPFDLSAIRFKPAIVRGDRALALAYVDARAVQDRLDEVLGVAGWQDEYEFLAGGAVLCRLKVFIGGRWLIKSDVGSAGERAGDIDRRKAAFSDALKRAAVKFGVGRYLYRLQAQWVDFDPSSGQFLMAPRLPPWALPPGSNAATPSQRSAPCSEEKISESQRGYLLELLAAKGFAPERLAQRYGARELRDLTLDQFEHALAGLARLPDRRLAG